MCANDSRRPLPVGAHAHQARVELVLQVAAQHAVLDQRRALGRRAFVVDVERAATRAERAVVDDGALLGGDLLADAAGERRRALAIEVAFQAVTDRFVQQHAGPARPEHDGHRAGRRRHRVEIDERAAHRFVHQLFPAIVLQEPREAVATAAAGIALLAPAVLLDDHRYVHAHQRPHVGGDRAVARHHQHDFVRAGQARHHLLDARIDATRFDVDLLEQLHLVGIAQTFERIDRQIQLMTGRRTPRLHRRVRTAARDRARRLRRFGQRRQHDLVRIREAGLLARQRTHADALLDAVRAVLDDAVFERPGLFAAQLEIQIGVVDAVTHDAAEHAARCDPRRAPTAPGSPGAPRRAAARRRASRQFEVQIAMAVNGAWTWSLRVMETLVDAFVTASGVGRLSNRRCDERRETAAQLLLQSAVDFRDCKARARRSATRASTWPHGSTIMRIAIGFAAVGVRAALRRRQHVAQILDRAGAHQQFPVRPAGRCGERRRQAQHFRALRLQHAKQLGKAHVVAHRQAEPADAVSSTTTGCAARRDRSPIRDSAPRGPGISTSNR